MIGALNIKRLYGDECLTVFVNPPSLETLKERLKKDAERRRVQREAEALESQRLEKMNQLVEKFGKKR